MEIVFFIIRNTYRVVKRGAGDRAIKIAAGARLKKEAGADGFLFSQKRNQNRSDRQLSPPSILRNSDVSTGRTGKPAASTACRVLGKPAGTSTVPFT